MNTVEVRTGIDMLLEKSVISLKNRKIGLITNHTGITRELKSTIEALCETGVDIRALFGPEHGIHGNIQDAIPMPDSVDEKTGIPIYSMFGTTYCPTLQMVRGIDTLVYDVQDVGARFFTYIYTMAYSLAFVAEHHMHFIVLDRPNPITGTHVEGALLEPRFSSFVGDYQLPFRYGLTAGELAQYLNRMQGWDANLEVIPLFGWRRGLWYDETGLPWVMPSPNLPTLETAVVFPGIVLFEGTNISEGRGTTRPFELIGAPWLNAAKTIDALYEGLECAGVAGVLLREAHFLPTFDKYMGTPCHGFQLHVTDRDIYSPVATGIICLKVIRDQDPETFQWLQNPKALHQLQDEEIFFVDNLAGTDALRKMIDQGVSHEEILDRMTEGTASFIEQSKFCHLYE